MNTQTTIVIVVAIIGFAFLLSMPAEGQEPKTAFATQFIQKVQAKEVAERATKEQREQFEKFLRESQARKEARESNPSERREEFLAQLTAYSIVGVIVALVYWVLNRKKKGKENGKTSQTK